MADTKKKVSAGHAGANYNSMAAWSRGKGKINKDEFAEILGYVVAKDN